MKSAQQEKFERLKGIVQAAGSAAVAFSGGVDSTFLLKVCVDSLGSRTLAITARSETLPDRELREATELARMIGAVHQIIDSRELEVPGFAENPPHRCYMCKSELFSKAREVAARHNIEWLFDGSTADDASDFRPGRSAAREFGVRSPLEEAGLRKEEVRGLSQMLGLPTWDKPSYACLSSRFPYHTKITIPALRQVERAEICLRELGFRVFRVRHHGPVARIELGVEEMERLWTDGTRVRIVEDLKSAGYSYVTMDLQGYRTGSMNETLGPEERVAGRSGVRPDAP
jgi:uncharacterized protein